MKQILILTLIIGFILTACTTESSFKDCEYSCYKINSKTFCEEGDAFMRVCNYGKAEPEVQKYCFEQCKDTQ